MNIGWFVGKRDWTYNNLANSLIQEMEKDNHFKNEIGDIVVVMSVDQLGRIKVKDEDRAHRKKPGPY